MMGLDNPIHLAFLLVVLLLVFGAKRLPELGHSLGTGLRGFKQAIGGESEHAGTATQSTPSQQPLPVVPTQVPPPAHVQGLRTVASPTSGTEDRRPSDRAA